MEVQSEAAFFPQHVLNCGGSGMAQWGCGEVELLEMSGILYFSCRTLILEGQWWPSYCPERVSVLARCEQKGNVFVPLVVGYRSPQRRTCLIIMSRLVNLKSP